MLVSEDYALKRGWTIDRSHGQRLDLELANGSYAYTSGVVRDLEWSFGGLADPSAEVVVSDFYVLKGLLSNEFVFELDVFNRFKEHFIQLDSDVDLAELHNIRLISHYSGELQKLEDQYLDDCE